MTERKNIELGGMTVEYTETGSGPTILFIHGVYVGGALWSETIKMLDGVRCIAPTLPLGAHQIPSKGADVSTRATIVRILDMIEALDLHEVTLVGNDTGGGLCLALLGTPHPASSRIARLVLTNCDSYEHFPPEGFTKITQMCAKRPRMGALMLRYLASKRGRKFFLKSVCATAPHEPIATDLFENFGGSNALVRDAVATSATVEPSVTLSTAHAIPGFDKPVLLAWGDNDALFPVEHAERLAADFPNAQLQLFPGAKTYLMIDQPKELATAIAEFVRG